jgi:hypothetical protein
MTQHVYKQYTTDPEFTQFIDKRIEFYSGTTHYAGVCKFAGINPLHGKFQVTIDRMPVWPVDKTTIKEQILPSKTYKDNGK